MSRVIFEEAKQKLQEEFDNAVANAMANKQGEILDEYAKYDTEKQQLISAEDTRHLKALDTINQNTETKKLDFEKKKRNEAIAQVEVENKFEAQFKVLNEILQ